LSFIIPLSHRSIIPVGLYDSNKRKLSSGLAFFSIGEEEIMMTTGAEIDPEDLFFLDSFIFHLGDIDLSEVHHPSPPSF
jgi:hypothetical protein